MGDWELWLFLFSLVLAAYAWTPRRRRSVADHRSVDVPVSKARRVRPARARTMARTPRAPFIFTLGRAYGRIVATWRDGVASVIPPYNPATIPPMAGKLPPLLVQDVSEAVDLALFERERESLIDMPYVEKNDPMLESLILSELGTSPVPPEPRDSIIAKALDKGLSANDLAVLMGGNRAAALAKVRAVKEAKAA